MKNIFYKNMTKKIERRKQTEILLGCINTLLLEELLRIQGFIFYANLGAINLVQMNLRFRLGYSVDPEIKKY